jgi:antitoxin component HigA of HigAB toxin-antitoxin module
LTDITSKHTEAARLLADLQKQKAALTPEVEAELTDLRKFKIAQDVESDPQFQTFKNEINANHEAIYKKLMQGGYTQENIDHIKSLGGPDNVDWNPLLDKLPAQTRLFLQGKLVANIELADKRDAALDAAKASGPKFLAERAERDSKSLLDTANGHLKNIAWTATKQLPATATPEQKTEIEAWNKEASESVSLIKEYLSDRSPERHAELAIGTLIAHRLQRELQTATTKLSSLEASHKTALDAVTAERDKLKTDLEKIKLAAIPRTTTPVDTINPAKKPVTGLGLNVTGMEALDAHYAAVHAQTNV